MNALTPLAVQNADALRALAQGGHGSVKALAAALGRDDSNLGKSLKAMETAGLVGKPDGEPHSMFTLTAAGRGALAAIQRAEGPELPAAEATGAPAAAGVSELLHAQIYPDPHNPRTDWESAEAQEDLESLAASIQKDGLLQNLVVRPMPADDLQQLALAAPGDGGLYRLVAGERRWRSIGLLIARGDWPADRPITAAIRDMDDATHRRLALIENLKRRDLNPIEEAKAFQQLVDGGMTTAELAETINSSQRVVQQRLQLLKLPPIKQLELAAKKITIEDARRWLAEQPEPLSARARLALAELIDKIKRDPIKGTNDRTEVRARTVREELEDRTKITIKIDDIAVAELVKRNVVDSPSRIYLEQVESGRHLLALRYYTGEKIAEEVLPGVGKAKSRADHIKALRIEVLGEEAAAAVGERSYAMPWLNGPFETDREAAKEIERKRAEREAREKAWKDEDAARAKARQDAEATSQARLQRAEAVELELRESGGAAFAELTVETAQDFGAQLPWSLDDKGTIIDAEGKPVIDVPYWNSSTEDRARRRLIVAIVNATAGLETPAHTPTLGIDPDAPERSEFVRIVATILQEVVDGDTAEMMTDEAAQAMADRGLAAFLEAEEIDYGDAEYDWEETGAMSLAQGIRVDGLGQGEPTPAPDLAESEDESEDA